MIESFLGRVRSLEDLLLALKWSPVQPLICSHRRFCRLRFLQKVCRVGFDKVFS